MPDSVPCTHIHYFLIQPSYYPVSPISVRDQDRKQNLLEEPYGESDLIQGIGGLRNLRAFGRMNSGSSGMLLAFCRKLLPLLEATVVIEFQVLLWSGIHAYKAGVGKPPHLHLDTQERSSTSFWPLQPELLSPPEMCLELSKLCSTGKHTRKTAKQTSTNVGHGIHRTNS